MMPKKKRVIIERDGKFYTKRGTQLTRASNTLSEAEFFSWLLSGMRRLTKYWAPKIQKKNEGRRKSQSDNKRLKWEYSCEECLNWFPEKQIEINHIIPCGGINSFEKIEGWCRRAFVEKEGFSRLCISCHRILTNEERRVKNGK